MGSREQCGNFKLVFQTKADDHYPVFVYRSSVTKLTVCVVQVEGPIVEGYISVATEAHDDDGLPHTLEHLVFMGSRSYPNKMILPKLGNRFLSAGTNAWTDVDHTCYTMQTAGSEGFCKLLPIFLDHVMRPLLTDSAFATEVHHINGDGEDSGVVYCEMQARENTGYMKVYRAGFRALYPGVCGYKSETGGILKNLRESTSNEKVRAYHKGFYRPENVWVMVLGHVKPEQVLESIFPVEGHIIEEGLNPEPFTRPWSSPVEPLEGSVDMVVPYPSDEEDHGILGMFWRGPSAVSEQNKLEALLVLFEYLTSTAVSPLRKTFVEIPSPLASSISGSLTENSVCALHLTFCNVPVKEDEKIPGMVFKVLKEITPSTLDMKRLGTIVHKRKLRILMAIENSPHSRFGSDAIGAMLYGPDLDDMTKRMNVTKIYDELAGKDANYWVGLMNEYIGESRPVVVIKGRPSLEFKTQLETEETERIQKQKESLGPEGLVRCARDVEAAIAENEAPFDMDVFKSESIPGTDGISFHSIKQFSNFPLPSDISEEGKVVLEKNVNAPHFTLADIPLRMQVDDVDSKFVRLRIMIDASKLDPDLRLCTSLFLESLSTSALKLPVGSAWESASFENEIQVLPNEDVIIPYQAVVSKLEEDTISFGAGFGLSGWSFSDYFELSVVVEMEKYVRGVQWLRDLLLNVVFQPERIQIMASKIAMSVAQQKKCGSTISQALRVDMNFTENSFKRKQIFTRQQLFLQKVADEMAKDLENSTQLDPDSMSQKWIEKLNSFREGLIRDPSGVVLHMSANLKALQAICGLGDLAQPWLDCFIPALVKVGVGGWEKKVDLELPLRPVRDRESVIPFGSDQSSAAGEGDREKDRDEVDPRKACVVAVGSVDSAYLWQTATFDVTSMLDPDFLPLVLLTQYLTQEEGPMWSNLRGKGLTYSFGIGTAGVNVGFLTLSLFKSAQVVEAYGEMMNILKEILKEGYKLDDNLVQTARSSLMFDFIESEKTVRCLTQLSVLTAFKEVPLSLNRNLLKNIWKVTPDQMLAAGRKHLSALLDPKKCRCGIVCNPSKIEEVVQQFSGFGWPLASFNSVDETFLKS